MCHQTVILCVVLILVTNCVLDCNTATSRTIPEYLINCYKNGGIKSNVPRNVQLLIELVSKMEKINSNHNVRTLSTSLLHSLRLDGIEKAPKAVESEFVIPFRASAFQFLKFSFLMDLLIPGENLENIREGLLESEICMLHFLLSSTVDPWERGDEGKICPLDPRKSNIPIDDATNHNYQPSPFTPRPSDIPIPKVNRTNVPTSYSRCPVENGVLQTAWGDIAPGILIAGISTALEPQNVKVHDILQEDFFDDKSLTNLDENVYQFHLQEEFVALNEEFKRNMLASNSEISNVLAATLSGDIAEMAIRQGPFARSKWNEYKLGGLTKWNDTLLPRHLYLLQTKNGQWEMTDAEILAGIDGFIIANYIKEWTLIRNRLRLSQIIEMYYSSSGIAFNREIRACNRRQNMLSLIKDSDLAEQALNLVNVLWLRLSTVYITPDEIKNIANAAVLAFENYWPKLLDSLPSCDVKGDACPMDAILVTDGTWTKYQNEQLMSILSETLDVSGHGSSLGLLHGNTGEWLSTPSHSILHVFDNIANYTQEWPNRLDLPAVLTTILTHFDNKTNQENNSMQVAGLPNVIIIAAPSTKWSEADLNRSRTLIESLRVSYTDVYILYLIPDASGFKKLAIDPRTHSDMLIETSNTNVKDIAEMIRVNFVEKTIPKRIIAPPCPSKQKSDIRLQHEDYINVGQKILYRIHPNHILHSSEVNVQFENSDMGEVSICLSRSYDTDGATSCQLINDVNDASFQIKNPCNGTSFCEPIYFIINARNTLKKCADKDCRYPDQIRFIVRHSGLQCRGNSTNAGVNLRNSSNKIFFIVIFVNFILSIFI